jgi:hypothetical protein
MRQGGSVCQIAAILEMKPIKQATIVVSFRCLENKSWGHLVSVLEAVPARIFCPPFFEQFAGILVEFKTGRCAHAKNFYPIKHS